MKKVIFSTLALFAAVGIAAWVVDIPSVISLMNRDQVNSDSETQADSEPEDDETDTEILELKSKARKNLDLVVKPVSLQNYWRKIQVPGIIVDRPGFTDQGVTAPIDGVVSKIHASEGDIVRPGDSLFTLRLIGQTIQKVQMDFHKAELEIAIVEKELKRVEALARNGIVPGNRIISLQQDRQRQIAAKESIKQNLRTFGLSDQLMESIKDGKFVTRIEVLAPSPKRPSLESKSMGLSQLEEVFYEIQDLKVELGGQVQAGTALVTLANHRNLFVKGHVFENEASIIKNATLNALPINVHFLEKDKTGWPELESNFTLRHLSSTIDPESRTFDFFISLINQGKTYQKEGKRFIFWRFRPGQRVRIEVPIEKFESVMVVPNQGVHRDNERDYVFQQNGDLFLRHSVKVLHKDRLRSVIALGGMLKPGFFVAQNSAATLNRILKSQKESGATPGLHVHADGTVHAAH